MGIILTACNYSNSSFCSLKSLSDSKTHGNMPYCRWGRMKLLYRILNTCWDKRNRFNLHIIPSDLGTLFDIFVKVHSMSNADRLSPKTLKSVTRSIICSFNYNCGIRFSMFRCLC